MLKLKPDPTLPLVVLLDRKVNMKDLYNTTPYDYTDTTTGSGYGYGCQPDNVPHEFFRIKHPLRVERVDQAGERRSGVMRHFICRRCDEHRKEYHFEEWSRVKQGLSQKEMWKAIGVDTSKLPLD